MNAVETRLAELRARINAALAEAGRRESSLTLIGASKFQPASAVATAVRAGLTHVGENYAQELRAKAPAVQKLLRETSAAAETAAPRWHFIGRLQRNKARLVAPICECIQSVDNAPLAREIDKRARAAGRKINCLLQVNLYAEAQKAGCTPQQLPGLFESAARESGIRVRGLMTLPPAEFSPEQKRAAFAKLRALRDSLGGAAALPELSMGMSADFEAAIKEGATIIRIGAALFGPRPAATINAEAGRK